jgi:hypothetical protein
MLPPKNSKERWSVHQTQWAAQFAVASELCKRNYQVALTMGNHPVVDLMAISPKGKEFLIDVKGLYKPNYWPVKKREKLKDLLFFVFAFVPTNAPNEFFVLRREEVNDEIDAHQEHIRVVQKAKGKVLDDARYFSGIPWSRAQGYKDHWRVLPK